MQLNFDPKRFPGRFILIDLNTEPATERMNCLRCGALTQELHKDFELCPACYATWSAGFAQDWLRERFK
jgi:hypothetical protein